MEKITLNNGLRLVLLPVPDVRSASFGLWVLSGSRYENKQNNGVSHFVEHMVFKGTRSRSAFNIADITDNLGGQINAYTAKEFTCFYGKTLDTHLMQGLDLVFDMLENPLFDKNDLETERGVILEEIGMYEDSPEDLASDLLHLNLFQEDMLGENIAGTKEVVSRLSADDLFSYMSETYIPERAVVTVGGSFDMEEVIKKVEALFKDKKSPERSSLSEVKSNFKQKPVTVLSKKDFEQISLLMSLPAFGIGDKRRFVMAALNSILGGSQTSRLNQKIREELGLAYSAYSYATAYINTGFLGIGLQVNPKNEEKAIAETVKILKDFTESLTCEEIKSTLEKIKISTVLGFESISSRVGFLGRNELLLGELRTTDMILDEIDRVTPEQVFELSCEIIDAGKLSLSVVGKVKKESFYKKIMA